MPLKIHQPAAPLSNYIEYFWYLNEQIPYSREKILPTNTVELIINFGDVFQLQEHPENQTVRTMDNAWLVGLQTKYLINEIMGHSHMIGIRFKPWGIMPFFQIPAQKFQNHIIEMDAIWQYLINDLREALFERPTILDKFSFLEQFFSERYKVDQHQLLPIQYAMQELANVGQKISIRELSETVGMSQKHLANQFKKFVGVSPKMMARLYRFQHVLQSINPLEEIDWAALAADSLYYDQSHFNKDFQYFTGLTPSAYLDVRRDIFLKMKQDGTTHFVPIG